MKSTHFKIVIFVATGWVASAPLAAEFPTHRPSEGRESTGSGGGGTGAYFSGGEPGSVVREIANGAVQAELRLSNEQAARINNILQRVRTIENEYFAENQRVSDERETSIRGRGEEMTKQFDETHWKLAHGAEKILSLLTPQQKTELESICRQAAATRSGGAGTAGSLGTVEAGNGAGGVKMGGGGRGGTSTNSWPDRISWSYSASGPIPLALTSPQIARTPADRLRFGIGNQPASIGRDQAKLPGRQYESGEGPGGVVRVISNEKVQEKLALTPDQRTQIADILRDVSASEAALNAAIDNSRLPSARELFDRQKQRELATRRAVTEAGDEIIRQLNHFQQRRLREICWQAKLRSPPPDVKSASGGGGFARPGGVR